jgi:hypothetical protein
MAIRELKPAADDPFWDAPSPVRSVMYTMVMGVPVGEDVPDPEDVVVVEDELLFEHPARTSGRATAAVSNTLLIVRLTGIFPPG